MIYIDSSGFAKYYSYDYHEKGSTKIKELINKAKQGKKVITSSIILIPEVISAFDKWKRQKILNEEDFNELFTAFLYDLIELLIGENLIFQEINNQTIISCIDYITKYNLSLNDSMHLHCAFLIKDTVDQFISSDKHLCNAAQQEGFNVINPEKESSNNGKNKA